MADADYYDAEEDERDEDDTPVTFDEALQELEEPSVTHDIGVNDPAIIALIGPTGCGKTYSAPFPPKELSQWTLPSEVA